MNDASDMKADFSARMVDILNSGALNLAMGIAYRIGLFEALDGLDTPRSASDIAAAAGLNERYVRELLGVLATGRVVEIDSGSQSETELFFLPKAHADLLTRRAGSDNLGVYTQEIPLLTRTAMTAVQTGCRSGEGIPYDRYPEFHEFMGQASDSKHSQVLLQKFLPAVDGGRLVARLRKGIRVCDVGCAEGVALLLMAAAFPRSRFVGLDISAEAVATAQAAATRMDLANLELRVLDAATLDGDQDYREAYDYVTAFDAIHDQNRPREVLEGIRWMLAPEGLFSMVDIAAHTRVADNMAHPMGPFLYTVSLMHCMPVGLVDQGAGLGMMWGREKAEAMLTAAGFSRVAVEPFPEDAFNLHYLCRR